MKRKGKKYFSSFYHLSICFSTEWLREKKQINNHVIGTCVLSFYFEGGKKKKKKTIKISIQTNLSAFDQKPKKYQWSPNRIKLRGKGYLVYMCPPVCGSLHKTKCNVLWLLHSKKQYVMNTKSESTRKRYLKKKKKKKKSQESVIHSSRCMW